MASAVSIRYQVEGVLARRHPAALRLEPRVIRPVYGTGVAVVDVVRVALVVVDRLVVEVRVPAKSTR